MALILPLGMQRQVNLYEFEASLSYRESSRTAKGTQENPNSVSEKNKNENGAGELARLLRTLAALPKGSIPGIHMTAHNCL